MKTLLSVIYVLIFFIGCAEKKPILGETEFQRKLNSEYKDASKSPLTAKDLKNFEGLDFFKFDSTYVVTATFIRTESEKPFKMKTTTDRIADYLKYGEIVFDLQGESFKLTIYQDQDEVNNEGYEANLFLPFLDNTNGDDSYGGGRYINLMIPESDILIVDFNTAYNPYCVYNEKYSCPIVPRENYLAVRIEAGLKMFKKK